MKTLAQLGDVTRLVVKRWEERGDLTDVLEFLRGQPAPQPQPGEAMSPFGVHEGTVDWLEDVRGWFVDTVHVWWVNELDYSQTTRHGHHVIARLNNGYGTDGTIPHARRYQEFADRVGYLVGRSTGCHRWIIGNEPNHPQEWPDGRIIFPAEYADCYQRCRRAIRGQVGHERDAVLLAGSAPWAALVRYAGNERGDWIRYMVDVAEQAGEFDGFALHAYVRRHNPIDVLSNTRMGAPFGDRWSNFLAYRDYMVALHRWQEKPVYITEFSVAPYGPDDPTWLNVNNGLLQAAYREIANWNSRKEQQIHCLVLYRGKKVGGDRWYFGDKPQIREDLRQAVRAWRGG